MKITDHELHNTWRTIIVRCYNKNHNTYKFYGAKGITVCDSWRYNFWNFVNDVGERPSKKHQLDRIDNNLGYFKENCRWVTRSKNCRNKSNNIYITYNGETLCATEWSERLGLHRCSVANRIRNGWDTEKAVTQPKNFNKDRTYKHKHKK